MLTFGGASAVGRIPASPTVKPVAVVSSTGSLSLDFCGFRVVLSAVGSALVVLSIASDSFREKPSLSGEEFFTAFPVPAPAIGSCGKTDAAGGVAALSFGMDTDISIVSFTSFLCGPFSFFLYHGLSQAGRPFGFHGRQSLAGGFFVHAG